MKEIPDWYKIILSRGNGDAMMVSAGIKIDEYLMKFNEGNLDVYFFI